MILNFIDDALPFDQNIKSIGKMEKDLLKLILRRSIIFLIVLNLNLVSILSQEKVTAESRFSQNPHFNSIQGKESSPVKAQLLLLNDSHPDYLLLGIYLEIEPGWYLYWLNPGDAGLPPQVKWELPEGFSQGELEFPIPLKFFSSGFMVYGYKEELFLVSRLSRSKGSLILRNKPAILKAKLNWMACRESCLIGEEELELDLASIDPDKREKAVEIWNKFKERFPKPAAEINVFLKEAKVVRSNDSKPLSEMLIILKLDGQDLSRIIDFYPLPIDGFILEAQKTKYQEGIVELSLKPISPEAKIKEISGLLISPREGYLVKFTLTEEALSPKNFNREVKK